HDNVGSRARVKLVVLTPTNRLGRKEPNNDHYRSRFSPRVSANSFSGHRHRRIPGKTADASRGGGEDLPCSGVGGPEDAWGNEGLRCKKKLWRERGREQLESFRLAPWASRRRRDLLELLDRLNPTITELSQAIQQEVEKCPEARRLMTHPGVGPLTALAFVLI